MKISIVGCGGISRTHIGAVRDIPYARIISVADCIPERAEAAAKQCGAKAYTSLEDMLAGENRMFYISAPRTISMFRWRSTRWSAESMCCARSRAP